MTIVVVCEFCKKRYRFKDDLAGTTAVCEVCGDVMRVPGSGSGTAADVARPAPAPAGSRSFDRPAAGPLVSSPAPPANECPECRATLADGSVICFYCGYDVRVAWKPPDARWLTEHSGTIADPSRPGVSDSIYKVSWGLQLILWDVVLTALINVALMFGPSMLIDAVEPKTMFRALAGMQMVWIIVMGLGMGGRMFCLLVPDESQAKTVIFGCVAIESWAMLVNLADFFFVTDGVSDAVMATGKVASLIAHVLFLVFLTRLAGYLRRNDLAMESTKSLVIGAIFVVGAILAVLARFRFPPAAMLFGVGSLLLLPLLFFPYLILLRGFHQALRRLV